MQIAQISVNELTLSRLRGIHRTQRKPTFLQPQPTKQKHLTHTHSHTHAQHTTRPATPYLYTHIFTYPPIDTLTHTLYTHPDYSHSRPPTATHAATPRHSHLHACTSTITHSHPYIHLTQRTPRQTHTHLHPIPPIHGRTA